MVLGQQPGGAQDDRLGALVEGGRGQLGRHVHVVAVAEDARAAAPHQDVVGQVDGGGRVHADRIAEADAEGRAFVFQVRRHPGGPVGGPAAGAQETVPAGRRGVGQNLAEAVDHRPEGDQAGLRAVEAAVHVGPDVRVGPGEVPDPQVGHPAVEPLIEVEAAAHAVLILAEPQTVWMDVERIEADRDHPAPDAVQDHIQTIVLGIPDEGQVMPLPVGQGRLGPHLVAPHLRAPAGQRKQVLVIVAAPVAADESLPARPGGLDPELGGHDRQAVQHLAGQFHVIAAVELQARAQADRLDRRARGVDGDGENGVGRLADPRREAGRQVVRSVGEPRVRLEGVRAGRANPQRRVKGAIAVEVDRDRAALVDRHVDRRLINAGNLVGGARAGVAGVPEIDGHRGRMVHDGQVRAGVIRSPAEGVAGQVADRARARDGQAVVVIGQRGRDFQGGRPGRRVIADLGNGRGQVDLVAVGEVAVLTAGNQVVVRLVGDGGGVQANEVIVADAQGRPLGGDVGGRPGRGLGVAPAAEGGVVAGGRGIRRCRSDALIERPIADQAGLRAVQPPVQVGLDVGGVAGHVPESRLVEQALEVLVGHGAAADPQVIVVRVRVADGAGRLPLVHQRAVGVRPDGRAVVGDRHVRPLVQRDEVAGFDPRPAGVGVGDGPPDLAVGRQADHALPLLVEEGLVGGRAGPVDPDLGREGRVHPQRGVVGCGDIVVHAVEGQGRADRDADHLRGRQVHLQVGHEVVAEAVAVLVEGPAGRVAEPRVGPANGRQFVASLRQGDGRRERDPGFAVRVGRNNGDRGVIASAAGPVGPQPEQPIGRRVAGPVTYHGGRQRQRDLLEGGIVREPVGVHGRHVRPVGREVAEADRAVLAGLVAGGAGGQGVFHGQREGVGELEGDASARAAAAARLARAADGRDDARALERGGGDPDRAARPAALLVADAGQAVGRDAAVEGERVVDDEADGAAARAAPAAGTVIAVVAAAGAEVGRLLQRAVGWAAGAAGGRTAGAAVTRSPAAVLGHRAGAGAAAGGPSFGGLAAEISPAVGRDRPARLNGGIRRGKGHAGSGPLAVDGRDGVLCPAGDLAAGRHQQVAVDLEGGAPAQGQDAAVADRDLAVVGGRVLREIEGGVDVEVGVRQAGIEERHGAGTSGPVAARAVDGGVGVVREGRVVLVVDGDASAGAAAAGRDTHPAVGRDDAGALERGGGDPDRAARPAALLVADAGQAVGRDAAVEGERVVDDEADGAAARAAPAAGTVIAVVAAAGAEVGGLGGRPVGAAAGAAGGRAAGAAVPSAAAGVDGHQAAAGAAADGPAFGDLAAGVPLAVGRQGRAGVQGDVVGGQGDAGADPLAADPVRAVAALADDRGGTGDEDVALGGQDGAADQGQRRALVENRILEAEGRPGKEDRPAAQERQVRESWSPTMVPAPPWTMRWRPSCCVSPSAMAKPPAIREAS